MGRLVLIVDDDEDLGKLMQILLRHHGIPSRHVRSLKELREVAESVDPCLIFLDNQLEDGRGIEEVQEIKGMFPSSRIVLMTAAEWQDIERMGRVEYIDEFLQKPVSLESIEKVVRTSEELS